MRGITASQWIGAWLAALGVAVVVGLTAIGMAHGSGRVSPAALLKNTPTSTVTLDPLQGAFTPEKFPTDAGFMSADDAWREWENGKDLPNSIPATYGLLTWLTGPPGKPDSTFLQDATPVWAYQEQFCLGSFDPPRKRASHQSSASDDDSDSASPETCTTWTFLDAKTGIHIVSSSVPN